MKPNHIFIIPDADRRHARRQYLVDLFRESPEKFKGALNEFPNENRFSRHEYLELEGRIEQFVNTGKDLQYFKDSRDLLNSDKIQAPLDYLLDSYTQGGEVFSTLIKYILKNNTCKVLSIYALQKRNLERTDEEISPLLRAELKFFRKWSNDDEITSQCNFKFVGDSGIWDLHKHRQKIKGTIEEFIDSTEELEAKACGNKLKVYVLAPYDSKWEINQAVIDGKFNPENLIVKEPVDLIIRCGNAKMPISGGLPYQTQFAQFASVKKYFPDFTVEDFDEVLDKYDDRKRESGV